MNFPSNPTVNQTYDFNDRTWKWNGDGWETVQSDPLAVYTAPDVLAKLLTVDGIGSLLDSDLLDGQHGSWYLDLANATGTLSAGGIPNLDWSKITTGKPTTLAGYGIVDAAASTHNHTLDALSNTTITANSNGEILKWNGSAWINNTLAEAGIQPAGAYLTANQTITLTGHVTGSGNGSFATTIAAGVITAAMQTPAAANSISGNNTGSAAAPLDLTAAQVRAMLNVADGATANTGTVTGVTATGPVVSSGGTAPVISMAAATTSVAGYLTSADWNTFNGKQAALGFTPYNSTNPSGYTSNTGTVTAVSVATANGVSGSSSGGATPALTLTLGAITPSSVTTAAVVLTATGAAWSATNQAKGTLGAIHLPAGSGNDIGNAITFGGTGDGAVQAGIYTIGNGGTGTSMYLSTTNSYATGPQTAISIAPSGAVSIVRAGLTVTGTVTGSNLSGTHTGTSSGTNTGDQTTITGNAGSATVLQTGRTIALSGAITGTATSFNGSTNISIPVTSVDLADAAMSGVLSADHLGTGTANSTTFLRGDGTWQAPPTGVTTLGALTDVTLGTPVSGEFLRHNGTVWVDTALVAADIPNLDWSKITSGKPTTLAGYGISDAAAASHNHTLDALSNTTITANTSGEILKWNGTAWINNTLAEAGIQPAGSYLTANQTITLTGHVTGSGNGSFATTIAPGVITAAMQTPAAANSISGNNTGSAAAPLDLTAAQVRTMLNVADGATANTGTVTGVTATGPVVSSGGTAPVISMAAATTSVPGYLTAADWNTFNGKQAALGFTPYNSTNPSGYTSNVGTVTGVTATGPVVSSGGAAPVISMAAATTSVPGYLTAADWNTFNGKQAALGFTPYNATNPSGYTSNVGTVTGVTATGPVVSSGGTAPVISMAAATGSVPGYLTAADWTTFNGKQAALGFTPYNSTNPSGYTSNTGTVTSVGGTGTVSGLSLSGTVTTSGSLTLSGTLVVAASNFASQTANFALIAPNTANGVPTFRALELSDIIDAWTKKAVRVATTANITLSGVQTVDGVVLIAGDRVLVKDQTTTAQNGIYVVAAGAWTRTLDASTSSRVAGGTVNVDTGTVSGGELYSTTFKPTDTLGTTAMPWFLVVTSGRASTIVGATPSTAAIGTSLSYARADHVHPLQTTITGNAGSATILQNARTIAISGAITGTATSFNGSAAISIPVTSVNLADAAMSGVLSADHLGTGTANSTTYLRGDGTWQVISGGAAWGGITGTLASQTDLNNALGLKAPLAGPVTHTGVHTFSGIPAFTAAAIEVYAEAATNANVTLRDHLGVVKGILYWGRTAHDVRLRRYNAAAAVEGELAITSTGITVAGGYFTATSTLAALSTTGAGNVLLRPNGAGSATGEFTVASSGAVVANGTITATAGISATLLTSSGRVQGSQNFESTSATAVFAATGTGNIFLRPDGINATTGQVTINTAGGVTTTGQIQTPHVVITGGGTFTTGSIYTDSNYGFIFRGRQAGAIAAYAFHNSANTELLRITDAGAVTTAGTMGVGGPAQFGGILSVVRPGGTQVSLTINRLGEASAQIGFLSTGTVLRIGNSLADGTLANAKGIDIDGNGFMTGPGISETATGSTLVRRTVSGYIHASYFNCPADVTAASPSQVAVFTGSDNYIRQQTLAQFRANSAALSTPSSAITTDEGVSKWMRWKNFGAGHIIFDASQGTSPAGGAISSNTNPDAAWQSTYPTLMGWNGSNTYGVRVYIANLADGLSGVGIVAGSRVYAGWDAGIGSSISCSAWFRSNGDTGWYNATYAGGVYMTDTTYLKSYSDKAMYASDFVTSSDRKLKTEITDFKFITPLVPRRFKLIASGKYDIGFIAQEVEEDYPELVGETTNEDGSTHKVVAYPKAVVILAAQVNDLQDQIKELTRVINEMRKL